MDKNQKLHLTSTPIMSDSRTSKTSCYTLTLNDCQAEILHSICIAQKFEHYTVNYARYAFRGPNFNLVMYCSGKLVLQGKGAADFMTFTIEPQVTQQFVMGYEELHHPEWFIPHAGLDESGKGDFFGPVITACVIAGGDEVRKLQNIGVRDSKTIHSDRIIMDLAEKIPAISGVVVEVMVLSMAKYNELYERFGRNLNQLLGWLHSCSLSNALKRRFVTEGLLDQFSKRPIVQGFIQRDFPEFTLNMRTKAEEDPVVAAASIVARAEYIRKMKALSTEASMTLPRGAGQAVKVAGIELFRRGGQEVLAKFSKTHFKTFQEICVDRRA